MFFYNQFASDFDEKMNKYDLNKRLNLFSSLLSVEDVQGKQMLDAGCGTGWFSKMAVEMGIDVTALDVGENLLAEVKKKCNCRCVEGNVLDLKFPDESFDIVLSTEVIEHTVSPQRAITEMYRVLKKGGILILSTPNKAWHFSVAIANFLKLRPYEGYENWSSWYKLKKWLKITGFQIEKIFGFNIVPFVHPKIYPVIDYFDQYGSCIIGSLMLNICCKARKI